MYTVVVKIYAPIAHVVIEHEKQRKREKEKKERH